MKKTTILIIALCVLILLSLGVTIWALFFREAEQPPITPDYPPQGTEPNQTPIEGDTGGKLEVPEGGGGYNVTYSTVANVSRTAKRVGLQYANPGSSVQNLGLLILIDDLVVAKSELITPGHQISELALEEAAASRLQVGTYEVTLVVRAYDPESGEKAMVESKWPLTLNVTD